MRRSTTLLRLHLTALPASHASMLILLLLLEASSFLSFAFFLPMPGGGAGGIGCHCSCPFSPPARLCPLPPACPVYPPCPSSLPFPGYILPPPPPAPSLPSSYAVAFPSFIPAYNTGYRTSYYTNSNHLPQYPAPASVNRYVEQLPAPSNELEIRPLPLPLSPPSEMETFQAPPAPPPPLSFFTSPPPVYSPPPPVFSTPAPAFSTFSTPSPIYTTPAPPTVVYTAEQPYSHEYRPAPTNVPPTSQIFEAAYTDDDVSSSIGTFGTFQPDEEPFTVETTYRPFDPAAEPYEIVLPKHEQQRPLPQPISDAVFEVTPTPYTAESQQMFFETSEQTIMTVTPLPHTTIYPLPMPSGYDVVDPLPPPPPPPPPPPYQSRRERTDVEAAEDRAADDHSAEEGDLIERRNAILKQIKARRVSTVPRTHTTCNFERLGNVMFEVIVDDVSVAKRAIAKATMAAFAWERYDVFCAKGEFSYSIHARKYCEVTRDEVTCFAFR